MITSVDSPSGVGPTAPRWRWRRLEPSGGQPMWQARALGQLGEDGATVFVRRYGGVEGSCSQCGRRAPLWHAYYTLPSPWRLLGPLGLGCTREHAARAIPE